MSRSVIPLPTKANLTVRESHEYVGSRPLFDHLIAHCGLRSLYQGLGSKVILYRVADIDTALNVLQLNGGWDATHQKAIHPSHAHHHAH